MDSSQRARKSYKYINQFSVIMSVGNLLLIHSTTTTKQQQNNNNSNQINKNETKNNGIDGKTSTVIQFRCWTTTHKSTTDGCDLLSLFFSLEIFFHFSPIFSLHSSYFSVLALKLWPKT